MITITIDNPEVERIYKEDFNSDSKKFSDFISEICIANNVEYDEDLSCMQKEIKEAINDEVLNQTHNQIWDELIKKHV
jgi:hypothetical protein